MRKIRRLKRVKTIPAGVDKMELYNIILDGFYKEELKENFLFMEGENKGVFRLARDSENNTFKLSYLKISQKQGYDGLFNELEVGSSVGVDKLLVEYTNIDINPARALSEDKTNTKNVSTSRELKTFMQELEKELKKYVCTKVDLSQAKIKVLETNVNIPLDRPFAEYERALNYMWKLLPKRMKSSVNCICYPNEKYTGFKIANKSNSLKFYDKKAQVLSEEGQDIEKELLRIEYRDENEKKVKDYLGYNEVERLLNDICHLDSLFRARLEKDLVSRIHKDIDQQIKDTVKVLKEYKQKYKSKYIAQAVSAMGTSLLDYEILKRAFEIVEEGKNKNTLKNNLTLIRTKLREKEALNDIKYFEVIEQINEILVALGYEKIVIK